MFRLTLISVFSLATAGHAAAESYDVAQKLTEIGSSYCALSFTRDIGDFDSLPWLRDLVAMKYPQKQFCNCIGAEFSKIGDDEMTAMLLEEIKEESDYPLMGSFLHASFPACMPEFPDKGLGIDLGLSDADLNITFADAADQEGEDALDEALADNHFAADEGDILACQMGFEDGLTFPGFNPIEALARVKKSGQSLEDVCGCAASYIASLGEPLQTEIENSSNPHVIYGSALAGGINLCING